MKRRLRGLSVKEAFTLIYSEQWWGRAPEGGDNFFSGGGSHNPLIVDGYIAAVSNWISTLGGKPDVVDLGCGDFAVGAKLRHLCGNYTACDVVEPLIVRNREIYKDLNVDFRVVDLTADKFPEGRVAFLRQVLQHLPNSAIFAILPKLQEKYEYLVLTDQTRSLVELKENTDMPAGPGWREVVLTVEPFNLRALETTVLCTPRDPYTGGIIRTTVYRLR
jgi:SAM-dependent methyltransferase